MALTQRGDVEQTLEKAQGLVVGMFEGGISDQGRVLRQEHAK